MFILTSDFLKSDDETFEPIPFKSKEQLEDRTYSLYLYAEIARDNKLHLKFGEAKDQSIYDRYKKVTGSAHYNHMIYIWESEKGDKEIHDKLRKHAANKNTYSWDGDKRENDVTNTSESYLIPDVEAFYDFIEDLNKEIGRKPVEKTHKDTYTDIIELVDEIYSKIA